jgi:hypothetical protein
MRGADQGFMIVPMSPPDTIGETAGDSRPDRARSIHWYRSGARKYFIGGRTARLPTRADVALQQQSSGEEGGLLGEASSMQPPTADVTRQTRRGVR